MNPRGEQSIMMELTSGASALAQTPRKPLHTYTYHCYPVLIPPDKSVSGTSSSYTAVCVCVCVCVRPVLDIVMPCEDFVGCKEDVCARPSS